MLKGISSFLRLYNPDAVPTLAVPELAVVVEVSQRWLLLSHSGCLPGKGPTVLSTGAIQGVSFL